MPFRLLVAVLFSCRAVEQCTQCAEGFIPQMDSPTNGALWRYRGIYLEGRLLGSPLDAIGSKQNDDPECSSPVGKRAYRKKGRRGGGGGGGARLGKTGLRRQRKEARGSDAVETWRIFGVEVHPDKALAQDKHFRRVLQSREQDAPSTALPAEREFLQPAVLDVLFSRLGIPTDNYDGIVAVVDGVRGWPAGIADIRVVRRSLDGRQKRRSDGSSGPRFVYAVDVDIAAASAFALGMRHQHGRMEKRSIFSLTSEDDWEDSDEEVLGASELESSSSGVENRSPKPKKRVIVVGSGPAGLFCALRLVQLQPGAVVPIVLERGQPVESRGRDIGALIHRGSLDSESNFAFGEGGAGTFSDGKLTTRTGRNSEAVRAVLETLVRYGAKESILIEGSPHLGTDNLVRLLRNMRRDLRRLGGEIRFGTKVTDLVIDEKDGVRFVRGVEYVSKPVMERHVGAIHSRGQPAAGTMHADAVVLATGHSARDVYEKLHRSGVKLEAKGFAVGFRIEHPQKLINKIQYGTEWGPSVVTGKATTDKANQDYFQNATQTASPDSDPCVRHNGTLPVPSYRLATDRAFDGNRYRGVYSFCMCPGGQIVPASTDQGEICVNGMSFSRRDSPWANSALVVTVSPDDEVLEPYREKDGVLAGVAFQRDMERRASLMGGGNLTAPVQRVTDFIVGRTSATIPPSSYRLGIKSAACHEIYPPVLTASLRHALTGIFQRKMPGFVCEEGLLHGVETRTSSPVRVSRDEQSMQPDGTKFLFPAGEGAGFAGGIVSAAVDGMVVADAVLEALHLVKPRGRRKNAVKKSDNFY